MLIDYPSNIDTVYSQFSGISDKALGDGVMIKLTLELYNKIETQLTENCTLTEYSLLSIIDKIDRFKKTTDVIITEMTNGIYSTIEDHEGSPKFEKYINDINIIESYFERFGGLHHALSDINNLHQP